MRTDSLLILGIHPGRDIDELFLECKYVGGDGESYS